MARYNKRNNQRSPFFKIIYEGGHLTLWGFRYPVHLSMGWLFMYAYQSFIEPGDIWPLLGLFASFFAGSYAYESLEDYLFRMMQRNYRRERFIKYLLILLTVLLSLFTGGTMYYVLRALCQESCLALTGIQLIFFPFAFAAFCLGEQILKTEQAMILPLMVFLPVPYALYTLRRRILWYFNNY